MKVLPSQSLWAMSVSSAFVLHLGLAAGLAAVLSVQTQQAQTTRISISAVEFRRADPATAVPVSISVPEAVTLAPAQPESESIAAVDDAAAAATVAAGTALATTPAAASAADVAVPTAEATEADLLAVSSGDPVTAAAVNGQANASPANGAGALASAAANEAVAPAPLASGAVASAEGAEIAASQLDPGGLAPQVAVTATVATPTDAAADPAATPYVGQSAAAQVTAGAVAGGGTETLVAAAVAVAGNGNAPVLTTAADAAVAHSEVVTATTIIAALTAGNSAAEAVGSATPVGAAPAIGPSNGNGVVAATDAAQQSVVANSAGPAGGVVATGLTAPQTAAGAVAAAPALTANIGGGGQAVEVGAPVATPASPVAGGTTPNVAALAVVDELEAVPAIEAPAPIVTAQQDEIEPPRMAAPVYGYPDYVDYAAGYYGGPCFAVAPAPTSDGGVSFAAFAADPASGTTFQSRFEQAFGRPAPVATNPVSPLQCSALSFVRGNGSYPSQDLNLLLETDAIASGSALAGKVVANDSRQLHLLIIDDEGKVQNLDPYLHAEGGTASFDPPITAMNDGRFKVQLLVAIAAPGPLQVVAQMSGAKADAFFAALELELAAGRIDASVAIAAFRVN
jgi:hypothetical protein